MKTHFLNWFSFIQRGNWFKMSKNTKKEEISLKNEKISFQTDFHLFKKGEISLKTCETKI